MFFPHFKIKKKKTILENFGLKLEQMFDYAQGIEPWVSSRNLQKRKSHFSCHPGCQNYMETGLHELKGPVWS